jgi:hypothetical protein
VSERDGSPGLPEHEQQAWDAIVASLREEVPGEVRGEVHGEGTPAPADPPASAVADAPAGPRDYQPPIDDDLDVLAALGEEDGPGFEPPEPPPIPRPDDAIGRASWAAVIGGPVLVVVSRGLGWDDWIGHAGLAIAIAGFVSLVWRMKDRDDGDDGAVV